MLHLIFKSPIDCAVLERMAAGDAAVFMESSVLGVLHNGQSGEVISSMLGSIRFYVLSDDMEIRGILPADITQGLEIIDYKGLVQLTVQHSPIMSWC